MSSKKSRSGWKENYIGKGDQRRRQKDVLESVEDIPLEILAQDLRISEDQTKILQRKIRENEPAKDILQYYQGLINGFIQDIGTDIYVIYPSDIDIYTILYNKERKNFTKFYIAERPLQSMLQELEK